MKLFSIIFFLLLSFSILSAQANRNYDGVKPEVYAGSKSLVFTYTPFQSNLGPLPAGSYAIVSGDEIFEISLGGIGFKYFASNQLSLLFSLGFGSGSSEMELGTDATSEASITTYGLSVDADYHLPILYSISTYVGANINYGAISTEEKYTYLTSSAKEEYSSSSFGIGLNVGFDWFFTEGLSLGGKYTLGYRSMSEPELTSSSGTSSETEKGPSASAFGTGIGTIVLSVHF